VTGFTHARKSLAGKTVDELLRMAAEFEMMSVAAVTQEGRQALEGIAARLRAFAVVRSADLQTSGQGVRPGAPASAAGLYELRNVFGTWVGDIVQVRHGELLPRAPREFTWHLVVTRATPHRPAPSGRS
jgi:hypothetical protein